MDEVDWKTCFAMRVTPQPSGMFLYSITYDVGYGGRAIRRGPIDKDHPEVIVTRWPSRFGIK